MDFIWLLVDLLMEFPIFVLCFGGLISAVVVVIVYKGFSKLLSMFS